MMKAWLAIPLAAALCAAGFQEKHPWAGFKPGSFSKMKGVTVMDMGGTKTEMPMERKYTLLEVTADKVVVEMEVTNSGMTNKMKQEIPLKGDGKKGEDPKVKPKTGTEEIEVGGKKYKCNWSEVESDMGGNKSVSKVW